MNKLRLKRILTLIYSIFLSAAVIMAFRIAEGYIKMNFKETIFLIGLFFVIIGIVILYAKNPIKIPMIDARNKRNNAAASNEDEELEEDERINISLKSLLLGVNGFTVVLAGVISLVVDAFL